MLEFTTSIEIVKQVLKGVWADRVALYHIAKMPFLFLMVWQIIQYFILMLAELPVTLISAGLTFLVLLWIGAYVAMTWHRRVLFGCGFLYSNDQSESQQLALKVAFKRFFWASVKMLLLILVIFIGPFFTTNGGEVGLFTIAYIASGFLALYVCTSVALVFPAIAAGRTDMTFFEAFKFTKGKRGEIVLSYIILALAIIILELFLNFILILFLGADEALNLFSDITVTIFDAAITLVVAILWTSLNALIYSYLVPNEIDHTTKTAG